MERTQRIEGAKTLNLMTGGKIIDIFGVKLLPYQSY
jgi:hypothetical protein